MTGIARRSDPWLGVSCLVSAVLHLAVFVFVVWWQQLFPSNFKTETTYYVDVVNLPVANPRAGSPTQTGNAEEVARGEETQGMKTPPPVALNGKGEKTPSSDASSFQQRMASLEKQAEERRQAAVIDSMKARASGGRSGMPGAGGSEAGSDYTAYVQSRLRDAFKDTISYQSKAPYAVVKLTIDPDGRVVRIKIEKSSGDRLFESSVRLAVTRAEQRIPPTPDRRVYEGAFIFKPQGVEQK